MINVFLHGFGSSSADFRSVWEIANPPCVNSIFLNGDQAEPLTGKRRWFPLSGRDETLNRHVSDATDRLTPRLKHALATTNMKEIKVVGHSQGGMIALELVRRGELPIIIAEVFAAYLPLGSAIAPWHGHPSKIILHASSDDEYIALNKVRQTASLIANTGITASLRVLQNVRHALSPDWFPLDQKEYR